MSTKESKNDGRVNWVEVSKIVAMPLVTLIVGYVFNTSLNARQQSDNNVRLYADMMGRREQSDSGLRKDMFQSILTTFLKKDATQPIEEELEQGVLNIELLAYNFNESLDLGPLFKHVKRELVKAKGKVDENLMWRLERVSEEVRGRQLAVLADGGAMDRGDVNLETMEASFGRSAVEIPPGVKRGGTTLCMSIPTVDDDQAAPGKRHWRQFRIKFLDFSRDRREVEIALSVSRPLGEKDCKSILDSKVEFENIEAAAQFWVGLFGFPMIDNTRLSHSERCAVSVTHITGDSMNIAVSFFQASRASLKDKLYYDEVLHELLPGQKSIEGGKP